MLKFCQISMYVIITSISSNLSPLLRYPYSLPCYPLEDVTLRANFEVFPGKTTLRLGLFIGDHTLNFAVIVRLKVKIWRGWMYTAL